MIVSNDTQPYPPETVLPVLQRYSILTQLSAFPPALILGRFLCCDLPCRLSCCLPPPFLPPNATAGETVIGLTTQNGIEVFDSAASSVSLDGGFVAGLEAGEVLLGIDYRPATGNIYVFGNQNNVYTLDLADFDATLVGNFAPPRLRGNSFGFDFNPAFSGGEFARIISNTDQNRVISGNTGQYLGAVEKTPVFYAAGDANAGVNPNIAGIAYTNSVPNSQSTQQYGIDASLGVLTTVANNAGTLNTIGSLGVSPLTNELGLDISGQTGIAYANLQSGPNSQLFTIDLGSGAASLVGTIASGDLIRDITIVPPAIPEPGSVALLALAGLSCVSRRRRS